MRDLRSASASKQPLRKYENSSKGRSFTIGISPVHGMRPPPKCQAGRHKSKGAMLCHVLSCTATQSVTDASDWGCGQAVTPIVQKRPGWGRTWHAPSRGPLTCVDLWALTACSTTSRTALPKRPLAHCRSVAPPASDTCWAAVRQGQWAKIPQSQTQAMGRSIPGSAPRVAQQGAAASQAVGPWRDGDGEVPRWWW